MNDITIFGDKFISYATNGTGEFKGDKGFSDQLKTVIHKASNLKLGNEILQKIIESGTVVRIEQNNSDNCTVGNYLNVNSRIISLNFDKHNFYTSVNDNNERELVKSSEVATILHEIIHLYHINTDHHNTEKRCFTLGCDS